MSLSLHDEVLDVVLIGQFIRFVNVVRFVDEVRASMSWDLPTPFMSSSISSLLSRSASHPEPEIVRCCQL